MSTQEIKPVTLKPYVPSSGEGLKKFIAQFPRLPYGLDQFDSFVNDLASGPDCVLDLWQASQRTAVAVLLDQQSSDAQSIEIALMAYRWDFSASQFLETVLPAAISKAHAQKKTRIEIISSLGLKVGPSDLLPKGFKAKSTTLTFETTQINSQLLASLPPAWNWVDASSENLQKCYELLKINFPEPEAAALVPFEKFEQLALLLPLKPRLLLEGTKPIAFVWVAHQNLIGQLLFLARHPDLKGKGLGKLCLSEAARLLKPFGFKKLVAEVKETDQGAVKLFESTGFKLSRKLTRFSLVIS